MKKLESGGMPHMSLVKWPQVPRQAGGTSPQHDAVDLRALRNTVVGLSPPSRTTCTRRTYWATLGTIELPKPA